MKIDSSLHDIYSAISNNEIKWNMFKDEWFDDYEKEHECIGYYEYYYAENELYIIKDVLTDSINFIKAKSPYEAYIELSAISAGNDYIRDFCSHCCNQEDCDMIPIESDGSIMSDFRHECRDFEYADEYREY